MGPYPKPVRDPERIHDNPQCGCGSGEEVVYWHDGWWFCTVCWVHYIWVTHGLRS